MVFSTQTTVATTRSSLVFLDQAPQDPYREDNLIDLFCGFGGSGGGLLDACTRVGREVQGHFVNHWDKAIEIHEANNPKHQHYLEDLFLLDPANILPAGSFVSLLWASPSCVHFSVARGAACVSDQQRSHAHSVTDWIRHLQPEGAIIENVPDFLGYGPVIQKRDDKGRLLWCLKSKPLKHEDLPTPLLRFSPKDEGRWSIRMAQAGYAPYMVPDKTRKGEYFRAWLKEVKALGYSADWRILCSADYGDPTIRKRLFLQLCREDCGKRIVWPNPTHAKPDKFTGEVPEGLKPWRTARDIIDWSLHGDSVFSRKKPLAPNTFRRLAIGLVKYGLRDFLLPSNKGWTDNSNVKSADEPLGTLTAHSRAEGLVKPEAYVIPKDQGWAGDYVRDIDSPIGTIQTTSVDHVAQPAIVQLKGQSTAMDIDQPLTALTACQSHYVMEPLVDHIRGTGVASTTNEPLRSPTSGGQHQALAEAFMMAIDQTGGGRNHGTYSVDEPVRTLVTKANASCIEFELVEVEQKFLEACQLKGVDTSRAETFLGFLVAELHKTGRIDAKPWIYVYYSSGSEGKAIDEPLPTVRTKAGHGICYPVIELEGKMLRIDLLYRMLTPLELQRAMGFSDSVNWAGCNNEQIIRAIGNSVSHGVARALGLAWYAQEEHIAEYLK